MAVAISIDGKDHVFNYGVMSEASGKPVTADTLFELGSISKTFTATLASYSEASGQIALTDKVSKYLPAMAGKPFGNVALLNLSPHTAGDFPLQLPDSVQSESQLMAYLEDWKPSY